MNLLNEMIDVCRKHEIPLSQAYLNNLLFLHLCEVQKFQEVKWQHNDKLNMLYCTASNNPEELVLKALAISSLNSFSMADVERWQDSLGGDKITLAIIANDSTIVFSDITNGIVKPSLTSSRESRSQPQLSANQRKLLFAEAMSKES